MTDRKAKEYYTVKHGGISVRGIDGFLHEKHALSEKVVANANLYSERDGDHEFAGSVNLAAYFSRDSSARFYLKSVQPDHAYSGLFCAIYSNGSTADPECDIEEKNFDTGKLAEFETWLHVQERNNYAENSSICFPFNNEPIFETAKGELP